MCESSLADQLREAFAVQSMPQIQTLIRRDGFDDLEKDSATKLFSGRTRKEIARTIEHSLAGIEELLVLEEAPLHYYVLPFLTYLISLRNEPDSNFSLYLSFTLAEIIRTRGLDIFTPNQVVALSRLCRHMIEKLGEVNEDELGVGVVENFERLEAQLRRK